MSIPVPSPHPGIPDGAPARLVLTPGISRNSVVCRRCGTQVESTSRHDMVACPCGAVAVDGGHAYLRRSWDGGLGEASEVFTDTSICVHVPNPYLPALCRHCGAALPAAPALRRAR